MSSFGYPNESNLVLEKSSELLEHPENGQSAAKLLFKELKEDSNYLIYNDGRVYSKKVNRFLKGKIDNSGYQVYCLRFSNGDKMLYAHRLVAEAFLENPLKLPYVHHKDENKINNNVDNLEWISSKDNYQDYLGSHQLKKRTPKYFEKNLEGEVWKVFEKNTLYSISNKGRIRNNRTNRLLKFDTSHGGYCRVMLNDRKRYMVHRLVYCCFNNDFDLEGYVIDHIDSNRSNNCLENLEKVTISENNKRRFND